MHPWSLFMVTVKEQQIDVQTDTEDSVRPMATVVISINLYLFLNLVHLMEYIQTLPSVIRNDVREINIYSYFLHYSFSCSNNNSNCKYDSIMRTISFVMG